MSHAPNGRTILTGTPKSVDNHLEAIFRKSTANEWTIDCPKCGKGAILDERSLGPRGVICPECVTPLDPIKGRWVARNPQAKWGAGFSVNHLMVPWLNYDDVLLRQETYDIGKFKNEVLGLSTTTGDHVVTRAELEACCGERAPAESYEQVPHEGRDQLVAGIDWGGGGVSRTVLVIGYLSSDNCFRIQYLKRFAVREEHEPVIDEIIKKCRQFRLRYVAADGGGNGSLLNRLLYDRLPTKDWLFGITYAPARHEPRRDGVLWKWMIDRTASIGAVFTRVKKRTLLFPKLSTSATFLDEFACEVAEYDDINRTVRYSHPETMQDDALHATNYALALGVYLRSIQNG